MVNFKSFLLKIYTRHGKIKLKKEKYCMNLYTFENLSDNSPELSDFKAFLQYSLHLYRSTDELLIQEANNGSEYIEAVFKKCHEICFPLFHKSRPYYFFGSSPYSYEETNSIETLYPSLNTNPEFWESAIKYQCIISALITLIHFNVSDLKISHYALCNKTNDHGYFSLLEKKILYIKEEKLMFSSYQKTGKSSDYNNLCSNFLKTFKTFTSKLTSDEKNILGIKSCNSIYLFNADLLYYLYKTNMSDNLYRKFNQFYINTNNSFDSEKYFKASNGLKEYLAKENDTFNKVDKLLLQYKLERYYNLSLNGCIMESITNLSNIGNIHIPLSITSIPPEILLTTFNLPNVFSRNGFFKFALYSFNNHDLADNTFYTRNNDAGPMSYIEKSNNDTNNLITWLDLYKKFITFFSYIIFPIYERCFLIILKENLAHKHKQDLVNSAISLLHQYLFENYDKILNFEGKRYKHQLPKEENSEETMWEFDENYKFADKLFGNQNSFNPNLQFNTKLDKNNFNTHFQHILTYQNSIVHPNPSLSITSEYLGFFRETKFHRKLINLTIESILNKY